MPKQNKKGKGESRGSRPNAQHGRVIPKNIHSAGVDQPPAGRGNKNVSALLLCGRTGTLNAENPVHRENIISYLEASSSGRTTSSYSSEQSLGSSAVQNLQWGSSPPPSKFPGQTKFQPNEESAEMFQHSMSEFSEKQTSDDDDDETQIPEAAAFTSIQASPCGSVEELSEEPVDDDAVDKTWSPHEEDEGTTSDEEVCVRLPVPTKRPQINAKIPVRTHRAENTTATSIVQTKVAKSASHKQKGSKLAVWSYFTQDINDKTKVICNTCNHSLSRGKDTRHLNTNAMPRHLKSVHPTVFRAFTKQQSLQSDVPVYPPRAFASHSSTNCSPDTATYTPTLIMSGSTVGRQSSNWLPRIAGNTGQIAPSEFRLPNVPTRSSVSGSSVQPTLQEIMEKKKKYPATHDRAKLLTACISKLLALEIVPFRFVESNAFRTLMGHAVPQYVVPSRHYFSRTAIPALHEHVRQQIKRALKQSVSGCVHLTTDTWTSKHGQGHYLSLTAHWVNIFDPCEKVDVSLSTVLPTPRRVVDKSSGFPTSGSSSSETSFPPRYGERMSSTPEPPPKHGAGNAPHLYRSARGRRQQAVLKLICLGELSHTAENIKDALICETELWFGPLDLSIGNVVCDNGRNLVAALNLFPLTHIPCLAHVFNLVVQAFLKQYPELEPLVEKVRKLCAHVRRSKVALSLMAQFQRKHRLPSHRLICDVPTRWNSTLHMLQRFCEQKPAIIELVMMTGARRINIPPVNLHLTAVEWSQLHDVCSVLQCLEYCTKVVSENNTTVSMTVPLLCTLKDSLITLRDQACATEEEEEVYCLDSQDLEHGSEPISGQHHSRAGRIRQWLQTGSQTQITAVATYSQEEEEEDEEEDLDNEIDVNEEASVQQSQTFGGVGSTMSRTTDIEFGWGDVEDTMVTLDEVSSDESPPGTLSHMSHFMLNCLLKDKRVKTVLADPEYWVATLLDPRFKDKVPGFISITPQAYRDIEMYHQKLLDDLIETFPPESSESRLSTSPSHLAESRGGLTSRNTGSNKRKEGIMANAWLSLLRPTVATTATLNLELSDRRQHFLMQVQDYMKTRIDVLTHDSFLLDYWVSKLEMWPELSQYALGLHSCPAASVFSERLFSTAGGVVTELRTRLSTENVNRLTFIKMNESWIDKGYNTPVADTSI